MTEVVNSYIVGHWAVARQMVDRHVSRCTTNVILVQNKETNKQPKEVYEQLITTFSQQGDLILDIGSGNGKESLRFVVCELLYTRKLILTANSLMWR